MFKQYSLLIKALFFIAGGFIIYYVFNKFNTTKIDTSGAKISDFKAEEIAHELYGAMDKLGTDENLIKTLFIGLSAEDFKLVFKKFGVRGYFLFNSLDFIGYPYNLVQWLREEIGTSIESVNKIIRDAGFTY